MTQEFNPLSELDRIRQDTSQGYYEKISDILEYQGKIDQECEAIVKECEDNIVTEQLIHNAIQITFNIKESDKRLGTNDIPPDKKDDVIYTLAKEVKRIRTRLAERIDLIDQLHEFLKQTSDIIVKFYQSQET